MIQLLIWFLCATATVVFIGMAIYKKIKKEPIKPWLIGAAISAVLTVGLIFIIGDLDYDPEDPMETQAKILQMLTLNGDDIEIEKSDEEYMGYAYKEYVFSNDVEYKCIMKVNGDETRVLEIYYMGVDNDFVIDALKDLNYPITTDIKETLDGGYPSLSRSDGVGIYVSNILEDTNLFNIIYDPFFYNVIDYEYNN
ncbi:hypothetical protein [Aerococcus tenax]|uniref:hypothetical protein n=1 Tax=Aerococcus tenax TaxID=3078812 RepID=UPI0018A76A9C|nr:hypothetical protein [Aerococcus tenax]